jgi:hypothetical protein
VLRVTRYVAIRAPVLTILLSLPNYYVTTYLVTLGYTTFGETYWLQKTGTAMGTPSACTYATISYGHYENTCILTNYQENLFYYRRYIDDVFGIWIPYGDNPEQAWEAFKTRLNSGGTLRWKIEEHSNQATFLGLNMDIKDSSITFSTHQKPSNLYLYLPPLSAHPFSCLKGLIKEEMKRYWLQNDATNFQTLQTLYRWHN